MFSFYFLLKFEGGNTKQTVDKVVIGMKGCASDFIQLNYKDLSTIAYIVIEKRVQLSLVDSSIGGLDEKQERTLAKVYYSNEDNYIFIVFSELVQSDRCYAVASLLFNNIESSNYIILDELDTFSYVSKTPEHRNIAPLLRKLSTIVSIFV